MMIKMMMMAAESEGRVKIITMDLQAVLLVPALKLLLSTTGQRCVCTISQFMTAQQGMLHAMSGMK